MENSDGATTNAKKTIPPTQTTSESKLRKRRTDIRKENIVQVLCTMAETRHAASHLFLSLRSKPLKHIPLTILSRRTQLWAGRASWPRPLFSNRSTFDQ